MPKLFWQLISQLVSDINISATIVFLLPSATLLNNVNQVINPYENHKLYYTFNNLDD